MDQGKVEGDFVETESLISLSLLFATLRGAVPLIFAALGGLLSERSGTIQIALEGMMLVGALFAAVVSSFTLNPYLGMTAGMMAGCCLAGIYGFFVLFIRADQIVCGTATNILALGLAPFVTKIIFDSSGSTPSLPIEARFSWQPTLLCLLVSAFVFYWFKYTRSGLNVQFAGEAPAALQASGTSVYKVRWRALLACGALAGLGGATLSIALSSSYSPNMTAGRGFIALAALIFGGWKPFPTVIACLFFAFIDAIQIRLQGVSAIPVQFIQILPYIVTIIAVSGFFKRSVAPHGLGRHI
jgi:simple sugar transport system permease protein